MKKLLLLGMLLVSCAAPAVQGPAPLTVVANVAPPTVAPATPLAPTVLPTALTPTAVPSATSIPSPVLLPTDVPTTMPSTAPDPPTVAPPLPTQLPPTATALLPSKLPPTVTPVRATQTLAPTATIASPTDMPITATQTPPPAPPPRAATATTAPSIIASAVAARGANYLAHTWQSGDAAGANAEAQRLCSTPDAIAAYNHAEALIVGLPVIVPVRSGCTPAVPSERLLLDRGGVALPRVAITLDAGASAEPTPAMLQTLRDHHVRITFFLTGKWMRDNPDLLRQIVADGHEVANHSLNHFDFTKLSDDELRDELAQTEEIAQQIAGANVRPFFRPPYGAYNKHVLDVVIAQGYLPIYWTVDSLDSVGQTKSPEFLIKRVTQHLPRARLNGAIFLMHCGSAPTAVALPVILDRFAQMGIEVTTISRVLEP